MMIGGVVVAAVAAGHLGPAHDEARHRFASLSPGCQAAELPPQSGPVNKKPQAGSSRPGAVLVAAGAPEAEVI